MQKISPIWAHLASFDPFGHIWPREAFFGLFFWPRLTQFGPVWPCLAPFGTIWSCLVLLGPTKLCLATLQFLSQGTLSYGFAKVKRKEFKKSSIKIERVMVIFVHQGDNSPNFEILKPRSISEIGVQMFECELQDGILFFFVAEAYFHERCWLK